jgi:hypothetical protein
MAIAFMGSAISNSEITIRGGKISDGAVNRSVVVSNRASNPLLCFKLEKPISRAARNDDLSGLAVASIRVHECLFHQTPSRRNGLASATARRLRRDFPSRTSAIRRFFIFANIGAPPDSGHGTRPC